MRRQPRPPPRMYPFLPAGTCASHARTRAPLHIYPSRWQGDVAGGQAVPGAGVGGPPRIRKPPHSPGALPWLPCRAQ